MIGIVGGMGPLAGLDVYRKIIEETKAVRDQDHPSVLLFSLPSAVPDRTEFLLGREKINPGYAIAQVLLKLEAAGATVAGIPCNTAHAPEILEVVSEELKARKSKLQLVHLIKTSADHLRINYPDKRIGILSTTGTRRTGLYKNALEKEGMLVIEPDESWQQRIHSAVYDEEYGIKAIGHPVSEKAISELKLAMETIKESGAEVLLLGCTEIPLALSMTDYEGLPVIDPNRLLARKLMERNSERAISGS